MNEFRNCILKGEWKNGHHKRYWIDRNTTTQLLMLMKSIKFLMKN